MDRVAALRAYQQADEDGVMVLVSRQACEECADEIERLRAAVLEAYCSRGAYRREVCEECSCTAGKILGVVEQKAPAKTGWTKDIGLGTDDAGD